MGETRWLNEREARAWRGFEMMRWRLASHLHRSLMGHSGLSLSDYAVLVVLSEAPDQRLRAFELGAALDWEKSRLSHHLTRMERRELIERQQCPSDARGLFIALTDTGRATVEAAAPHHVEDVRDAVIDLLTDAQLDTLAEISEKVLAQLPDESERCAD
jgi:DNA-binding MarR family transcriptional regulator